MGPRPTAREKEKSVSDIVLIGAHGKVALLAAPLLVERGHAVTGVVRNPDHVADVEATGATPLVSDVERLETAELAELVEGRDVVVWSAGAGGGSPARTYAVDRDAAIRTIDAASSAGVPRFVMVSYFGAGPDHGVPPDHSFFAYAEAKSAADAYLARSGLAWTILRPSSLTLEEPTGRIQVGGSASTVSRGNVAQVIAAVVDQPEATAGRIIEFNDGEQPIGDVIGGR